MPKVISREYKVMLDHRMLRPRKDAIPALWADLARVAERVGARARGEFDAKEKRTIEFLDTPDFTLRKSNLILRRRIGVDGGRPEYTLKCRTEDRYVAGHANLRAGDGWKAERKFEEDIAVPFRSRYSHSATIKTDKDDGELPQTLGEAAAMFPALAELRRDGSVCDQGTPLSVVNGFVAHERVSKGPRFKFAGDVQASVALILWSHAWKGRAIAAELSFRYGNDDEKYRRETAEMALALFIAVQTLDWCAPQSATKTQFAYGGASG